MTTESTVMVKRKSGLLSRFVTGCFVSGRSERERWEGDEQVQKRVDLVVAKQVPQEEIWAPRAKKVGRVKSKKLRNKDLVRKMKIAELEKKRDEEALASYFGTSMETMVKQAEEGNAVVEKQRYDNVDDASAGSSTPDLLKTPERRLQGIQGIGGSDSDLASSATPEQQDLMLEEDSIIVFDENGAAKKRERTLSICESDMGHELSFRPMNMGVSQSAVLLTPQQSESNAKNKDLGSDSSASDAHNQSPRSSESGHVMYRVFNKRVLEELPNSCFLDLADKELDVISHARHLRLEGTRPIRRNLSYQEISFNTVPRTKSEQVVQRRRTALVLMDEEEAEEDLNNGSGVVQSSILSRNRSVHRKLSNVYDHHHVHLRKLKQQMGDSGVPAQDLLALMARKMFASQAMVNDSLAYEDIAETTTSSVKSHDLEDCSKKLAPIKTRVNPAPSCHL